MASTMFESTYAAYQEITKTFDIIWALDAGLWNLRTGAQKFYSEHPNATESQAKDELIYGLQIHGINLKRIANELTWEYSIRFHLKSVHMYAPYVNKTDDVYLFLSNNLLIV